MWIAKLRLFRVVTFGCVPTCTVSETTVLVEGRKVTRRRGYHPKA